MTSATCNAALLVLQRPAFRSVAALKMERADCVAHPRVIFLKKGVRACSSTSICLSAPPSHSSLSLSLSLSRSLSLSLALSRSLSLSLSLSPSLSFLRQGYGQEGSSPLFLSRSVSPLFLSRLLNTIQRL